MNKLKRHYFNIKSAIDNADDTINVIITARGSRYNRKGEWIKRNGWTCSVCGFNLGYRLPTNYCPNCGARMMEGEQENE